MKLTRNDLKFLLETLITCSKNYGQAENINRNRVYEIANANNITFKQGENIWDVTMIAVDKSDDSITL